jgi:ribosomal protein L24
MNAKRRPDESAEPTEKELEIQHSNVRSIAKQEKLKRIIKQHPHRDLPRVDSVEPTEIPET